MHPLGGQAAEAHGDSLPRFLIRLGAVVTLMLALIVGVIVSRLAPWGGHAALKSEPDLPLLVGSKADRIGAAPSVAAGKSQSSGVTSPAALAPSSATDGPGLIAAARLMIPSPPGTDPKLQNVDPRILQALFQRSKLAMEHHDNDEAAAEEGARLMNAVGALGYGPARALITVEYPTSVVLQNIVPAADAVRYSLDPLLTSGEPSEGRRPFLVLLATYFAGRRALPTYAGDLLGALHEDSRLQGDDRLQALLGLLAHVRGACTALGFAIVKTRSMSASECSAGLELQIAHYIRSGSPAEIEAEARRGALRFLAARGGLQYGVNEIGPAYLEPARSNATSGARRDDSGHVATSNTAQAPRPRQ